MRPAAREAGKEAAERRVPEAVRSRARAVQGLGGGGLFALSQILIGDMLPPRERGKYAAWISGMWAVAGIAGPLLGGTLARA